MGLMCNIILGQVIRFQRLCFKESRVKTAFDLGFYLDVMVIFVMRNRSVILCNFYEFTLSIVYLKP